MLLFYEEAYEEEGRCGCTRCVLPRIFGMESSGGDFGVDNKNLLSGPNLGNISKTRRSCFHRDFSSRCTWEKWQF